MREMLWDHFPDYDLFEGYKVRNDLSDVQEEPNDEAKRLYRLLDDIEQPLYPGCKSSQVAKISRLHMGGEDGNPPTLETMYFETRKAKNKTLEEAARGN
ncbi:hypothetical protein Dimus_005397, partial [Dionaea muscipula]